jgi:hypothetical protein
MQYEAIVPMARSDLVRLLESGKEESISHALLSAASYDDDWRWAQATCLHFLDHPAKNVRWNAVTGLGYIARVHRQLEMGVVIPRLMALRQDPEVASNVEDALDDIKRFMPTEYRRIMM